MTRELKFYLQGLKEYGVYIGAFLILLLLTIWALLPVLGNLNENRRKSAESKEKLHVLNEKLKILEEEESHAREKIQRLNLALPVEKDVGLMLNSIERTSVLSNVSLGSFSFAPGSIISPTSAPTSKAGTPRIEVNISLRATAPALARFIDQIHKTLPVMKVESVNSSGELATIALSFFFKPLDIKASVDSPLPKVTPKQEQIYNELLNREAYFVPEALTPTSPGLRDNPFF